MKKAVAYCRVSTNGQVEKFGIESQKKMIREYAEAHDIRIMEWYIDGGVSGALEAEDRPELSRLLYGEVSNPPVEAVIVAKNDRVARDIYVYFAIRHELQKKNVELISVNEDFGALGQMAPMFEALLAAMAQMERENIKMRTQAGRKQKAYSGGYCGGNVPYGYASNSDGRMTVEPGEAAVVKEIFSLREQGYSLRGVSDILLLEGHTTRNRKAFSASTIKHILDNRKTYEGQYKYGGMEWTEGQHEAILDVKG